MESLLGIWSIDMRNRINRRQFIVGSTLGITAVTTLACAKNAIAGDERKSVPKIGCGKMNNVDLRRFYQAARPDDAT